MPRIRVSLSVEGFKERAMKTWGLEEWKGWTENNEDVVFFGLYTKVDYDTYLRHKGKKRVFWCGSDILGLLSNYESRRIIKLFPEAEHWCENEVEAENLKRAGIEPKVVPSFLDDFDKFPVSFKPSKKPHVWLCGHAKREDEYGWDLIEEIAEKLPDFTFHIYGADKRESLSETPNIIYHGRVPEDQFNKEIREYQCGLRTNEHDGFSEVIAKSILLGQYPISKIPYEGIWTYKTIEELIERLNDLAKQDKPNEVRDLWINKFNKYSWI